MDVIPSTSLVKMNQFKLQQLSDHTVHIICSVNMNINMLAPANCHRGVLIVAISHLLIYCSKNLITDDDNSKVEKLRKRDKTI